MSITKQQKKKQRKENKRKHRIHKEKQAARVIAQRKRTSSFADWLSHLKDWGMGEKQAVRVSHRNSLDDKPVVPEYATVKTAHGDLVVNAIGVVQREDSDFNDEHMPTKVDMMAMKKNYPGRDLRDGFLIQECGVYWINEERFEVEDENLSR